MKNVLIFALVAGAGAGATSAIVVGSLGADASEPRETATGVTPGPVDATEGLAEQLAALAEQNRDLRDRIRALESRPVQAPRTPVEVDAGESVATLSSEAGLVEPAFIDQVDLALEIIREREDAERDQRREEAMLNSLDERMEHYRTELGLTDYQADEMKKALVWQMDRNAEIWENARENNEFFGARDEMRALRDETDATITSLLTPDQKEQYDEMGGGRWSGFGGFDRGGRGGRGGGF